MRPYPFSQLAFTETVPPGVKETGDCIVSFARVLSTTLDIVGNVTSDLGDGHVKRKALEEWDRVPHIAVWARCDNTMDGRFHRPLGSRFKSVSKVYYEAVSDRTCRQPVSSARQNF